MRAQRSTGRPPLPLRPAVSVVTRFRMRARLFGLIAVLLVPGAVTMTAYWLAITDPIAFAQRETSGTAVLHPALTAMTDVLAGRDADLDGVVRAADDSGLSLGQRLGPVRDAVGTPTSSLDAAGRAKVEEALAGLVSAVGDDSNLILDPDLDSFYVMDGLVVQLPRLLVAAAQAAAPDAQAAPDRRLAAQAVLAGLVSGAGSGVDGDRTTALAAPGTALREADLTTLLAVSGAAAGLADHLTSTLSAPAAAPADHLSEVSTTVADATSPTIAALDRLLNARIAKDNRKRTGTLAMSGMGLTVAAWFALAVLWRTRRDVDLAVSGVSALAAGDLEDLPLPDGRDEFADIGRAVARARATMQDNRAQLELAARQREEQVQASFVQQATAQAQLRRRAQAVIDETASTVGAQLSEVSHRVTGLQGAASTIDERVSTADAATRSVVSRAEEARSVLGSLGSSLQQVAGLARVIAGVADQTKLLALNATIEAARAGESGRGFAVVADEVKNLASTTADATADVARTISALESDARATVTTIEAMADGIAEVDDATAVLRSVAVDQRSLVDELSTTLEHAVTRITGMSALTDRLERRHFRRVPITGKATLRRASGEATTVDLVNISRGGLLCHCPAGYQAVEGDVLDVEFALEGQTVRVHASVRRQERSDATRVALEFGEMPTQHALDIDTYVAAAGDDEAA